MTYVTFPMLELLMLARRRELLCCVNTSQERLCGMIMTSVDRKEKPCISQRKENSVLTDLYSGTSVCTAPLLSHHRNTWDITGRHNNHMNHMDDPYGSPVLSRRSYAAPQLRLDTRGYLNQWIPNLSIRRTYRKASSSLHPLLLILPQILEKVGGQLSRRGSVVEKIVLVLVRGGQHFNFWDLLSLRAAPVEIPASYVTRNPKVKSLATPFILGIGDTLLPIPFCSPPHTVAALSALFF